MLPVNWCHLNNLQHTRKVGGRRSRDCKRFREFFDNRKSGMEARKEMHLLVPQKFLFPWNVGMGEVGKPPGLSSSPRG